MPYLDESSNSGVGCPVIVVWAATSVIVVWAAIVRYLDERPTSVYPASIGL